MEAAKPEIMKRQLGLLRDRYDLSDRPAVGVTMSRGKPIQDGARAKLPAGTSWAALGAMTPDEIKDKTCSPGLHAVVPSESSGRGMLFPKFHIEEIKKQESRDLTRYDLEFDLPDQFLPEFPAAIYLTTRPDLGDVSHGKVVTIENYDALFNGILNPKQLEGLRLLVTPFPQQQFNSTDDRRTVRASRGVTCFDCHATGIPTARPTSPRRPSAIVPPSDRDAHASRRQCRATLRLATSAKERRGLHRIRARRSVLRRGSRDRRQEGCQPPRPRDAGILHGRIPGNARLPPAPKLRINGKLDPRKATPEEIRGQELFFGKADCASCHTPPYYTDNLMHNLKTERFFKSRMINNHSAIGDGPIKTFPLRGIKDSPPYLHDGRLLTLNDTVEFFNLIMELKLSAQEKDDLVAFMRQL